MAPRNALGSHRSFRMTNVKSSVMKKNLRGCKLTVDGRASLLLTGNGLGLMEIVLKNRMENIDGLRGFAAISVVLGHWIEFICLFAVPSLPVSLVIILEDFSFNYFSLGRMGVVAFFCVSGFVIPFSFRGSRPAANFVIGRLFRLYPAYWAACAMALVILPSSSEVHELTVIAANATMLTKFLGQPYIIGIAWTLTLELIFYGICFFAFKLKILLSPVFNLAAIFLLVSLAMVMAMNRWLDPASNLPAGTITFLATMHFGTFVRLWYVENDRLSRRVGPYVTAMFIISCLAVNYIGYSKNNDSSIQYLAISGGFLVGLAVFFACLNFQSFRGGVWKFLGSISYSVYLIHAVIIIHAGLVWNLFSNPWIALTVLSAAYFTSVVLVAYLMYRFIEVPGQKIGRRLKLGA